MKLVKVELKRFCIKSPDGRLSRTYETRAKAWSDVLKLVGIPRKTLYNGGWRVVRVTITED